MIVQSVLVDTNGNPISLASSLVSGSYDYISVTYPLDTEEVYTFKSGGSGGTTIKTITITYTDSSKSNISTVAAT